MMETDFDYRDVLLKAASRVEQEGMWCQGAVFENKAPYLTAPVRYPKAAHELGLAACAMGSLAIAEHQLNGTDQFCFTPLQSEAMRALDQAVGLVGDWNDAPGRTAHEVAEVMRQAAQ